MLVNGSDPTEGRVEVCYTTTHMVQCVMTSGMSWMLQ